MARDVMDLAVVTAAWGTYGRFLPDWAASIAEQTVAPAEVVLVDAGIDDQDARDTALVTLEDAGIDHVLVRANYEGMGAAMNLAVSRCSTEWVIRLDADDTLLPWAIEDVRDLAADADVVSLGAIRDGRAVLFEKVSAEWILSGRQGSLAPSAFRRRFWEQAPFIEANDWIESAFWVGLAHQGARFVPTERPGFVYRQWSGSHSATISPRDKAAARRQHLDLCARWAPA